MYSILEFVQRYPTKHFEQGETIYHQGISPECIYTIKSGYVKIYDINSQGVEQLVWLAAPGDIIPISSLYAFSETTSYFFSAFTNTEVYCTNKDDLLGYIKTHPLAAYEFSERMAAAYIDALHRLNALEKPKAEEKILYTLYFLANRFNTRRGTKSMEIAIPLTHQHIASLLGLTRETVAVELKKIKDRGLIFYDRWHFIVYMDKVTDLLRL